jgi:restriction system protein
MQLALKFASEHPELVQSIPPSPDEDESPLPVTPWVRFFWFVSSRPPVDTLPPELAELVSDFQRRSILDLMFRTEQVEWDGSVPLRELFELGDLGGGIAGGAESPPLIDQRFIDYLDAQLDDLSRMHWRQFEFLVGEFFCRNGYDVHVTPPSGDGGVDVRAARAGGGVGPELVLIQAKRFSSDRQVGVETVKALWSDIDEVAAIRGVVATTSTLAAGARAYCEARRYRLTAAERPIVEKWLRELATYPQGS